MPHEYLSGAIGEAAHVHNHLPDLINIALERLAGGCFELPAFSTLDKMTSRIWGEVNGQMFAQIVGRPGPSGVGSMLALPELRGPGGKTRFDRLNRSAPRPSWTNFRKQPGQLRWAGSLGDTGSWLEGIAATKLSDSAGEADAADAGVRRDYGEDKLVAVLACLTGAAQARARDDVAEMFCRRVATLTRRARLELEELQQAHRAMTERLIASYRTVLERIDPDGPDAAKQQAALEAARAAVVAAGGFAGQYAGIDRVSAHHGDNHAPLAARHFRKDRASMLAMAGALDLQATSADHSVLAALGFAREHTPLTRDH
ncbi:MAG: Tn3 family transposase, partial [Streptosporangiaceae bacterium]